MNSSPLMVFYDGGCSLCGREIQHYRRLPATRPIDWIDVTREPEKLTDFNINATAALAEFHVLDETRRLHKGADGFLLLWSALPYYRRLSSVCQALRIQPLMRWLYARFARWHFRRRCAAGACVAGKP